jgi:beta-galactosidase/beta-glucuronidase
MRIVDLDFEIVRATPAVAEFLVHVELDLPVAGHDITGRAVGPHCPNISTVEVSYPMTATAGGGKKMSLRCAIPEPNLWTAETPFTYGVTVELRHGGKVVETRSGAIKFRTD